MRTLRTNGYVVLGCADAGSRLVPADLCVACESAAASELDARLQLVRFTTSIDPREEPFRFSEICMRSRASLRYDMMLAKRSPPTAWRPLFRTVDQFILPLVEAALESEPRCQSSEAAPAGCRSGGSVMSMYGCVVSEPCAPQQRFHRDGTSCGALNVFVPLVDVDECNGCTEFVPGPPHGPPADHVGLRRWLVGRELVFQALSLMSIVTSMARLTRGCNRR